MKKPPKRLFKNRPDPPQPEPESPGRRFQQALLAEALADYAAEVRAGRSPCLLCGEPGSRVGAWFPTDRYSRYLGAPPGKTRVVPYALCDACHTAPDSMRTVEDAILLQRQARLAAAEVGLSIEAGFLPFGNQADLERFAAAYDRNAPPEGT